MARASLRCRPHLIPSLAATVLLIAAVAERPYGYYVLLRWATCAAAIFVAYKAYVWKGIWAVWLFGFVAVLFNPLFRIHLTRDIWRPVDVVTAAAFVAAAFVLRQPHGHGESGKDNQVQ